MQNAIPNPYYFNPENDDFSEDIEMIFNSEIFRLDDEAAFNTGNDKYESLMQKLIDPGCKDLMLNIYSSAPITKSWQKDGSMLVHVEYIRIKEKKRVAVFSDIDGVVDAVSRVEAGGYTVVVGGHPYSVPSGMDLQVTIGTEVEAGQLIAGSHSPKSDDKEY